MLEMLAVCRTTIADVHCHIQHGAFYATHQFALGERRALEMKATHNAVAGL